jgi:pimeloyl-ACP methyl ester carboxylesterase
LRQLRIPAADGFPLSVQIGGPDHAPPLLLLQGQANSHLWWRRTRGAFEDEFQTITFDHRGTGASRGPVGAWSTAGFAADAAQVLTALGHGAAAVYGTSMGGRIAQILAAERPTLVSALVLACTTPGGPHAQERGNDVRRSLADPDAARRRRALFELFYTPAWPDEPEDSTLLGDPDMSAAESAAHLRASARHNAWDLLPAIVAPTLILHGSDDLMTPVANAALLGSRIRGAEVVIHPGGRHGFFEQFADAMSPVVRRFLVAGVVGVGAEA